MNYALVNLDTNKAILGESRYEICMKEFKLKVDTKTGKVKYQNWLGKEEIFPISYQFEEGNLNSWKLDDKFYRTLGIDFITWVLKTKNYAFYRLEPNQRISKTVAYGNYHHANNSGLD